MAHDGYGTGYERVELTYGIEFSEEDHDIVWELDEMLSFFLTCPNLPGIRGNSRREA